MITWYLNPEYFVEREQSRWVSFEIHCKGTDILNKKEEKDQLFALTACFIDLNQSDEELHKTQEMCTNGLILSILFGYVRKKV